MSGRLTWGSRPGWAEIPAGVRTGIQHLVGGPVASWLSPVGGFSSQLATRLTLADSRRVFVKSAPAESDLSEAIRFEAAITAALPKGAPAPTFIAAGDTAGWFSAVYADLPGRHPDLSPGRSEVATVLDMLADVAGLPVDARLLAAVRGPAPVGLGSYLHGWGLIAAAPPADLDPWAVERLPLLTDIENRRGAALAGDALVHCDARADNMLIYGGDVRLVDWAHAMTGAPWIDTVSLAPQMIMAGWDPAAALKTVLDRIDPTGHLDDVTAFLTALTGYWERASRLPAPLGSPGLRPYQRTAATSGARLLRLLLP